MFPVIHTCSEASFVNHSIALYMFAVVNFLKLQNSTETVSSVSVVLPDTLRYIYQQCLLEADQELLPSVIQVVLLFNTSSHFY